MVVATAKLARLYDGEAVGFGIRDKWLGPSCSGGWEQRFCKSASSIVKIQNSQR